MHILLLIWTGMFTRGMHGLIYNSIKLTLLKLNMATKEIDIVIEQSRR